MITTLKQHLADAYDTFKRLDPRHRFLILTAAAALILGVGFLLIKAVTTSVAGPTRGEAADFFLDFPDADSVIADAEDRFAGVVEAEGLVVLPDEPGRCFFVVDDLDGSVASSSDVHPQGEVFCGPVLKPGNRYGTWFALEYEVSVKRDGSASAALMDRPFYLPSHLRAPFSDYDEFHSLLHPDGTVREQGHAALLDVNANLEAQLLPLDSVTWTAGWGNLVGEGDEGVAVLTGYTTEGVEPYRTEIVAESPLTFKGDEVEPVDVLVQEFPYVVDSSGNRFVLPKEYRIIANSFTEPFTPFKYVRGRGYWDHKNDVQYAEVTGATAYGETIPADGSVVLVAVHASAHAYPFRWVESEPWIECDGDAKWCSDQG